MVGEGGGGSRQIADPDTPCLASLLGDKYLFNAPIQLTPNATPTDCFVRVLTKETLLVTLCVAMAMVCVIDEWNRPVDNGDKS